MTTSTFKALMVEEQGSDPTIKELTTADLPEEEVLVEVTHSSVNYKDGLAVTSSAPVIRQYPMVPGIDLAGKVIESSSPDFKEGDEVVLTGWEVGEKYWGGFAQQARLKAKWLVTLPEGLSSQQSMAIGTAGFTAMLCVMALEAHGVTPEKGEVVVTGATGGVGSTAVALLAELGYQVVASTGKYDQEADYLTGLGASRVIGRFEPSKRPLDRTSWAGAVDTVGGETLATLLKTLHYGGSVAACGLAGGGDLPTTVYPFILRSVNLLGIDSVHYPQAKRIEAWQRLSETLSEEIIETIMDRIISLEDIPTISQEILKGQIRGRVVVDLQQ